MDFARGGAQHAAPLQFPGRSTRARKDRFCEPPPGGRGNLGALSRAQRGDQDCCVALLLTKTETLTELHSYEPALAMEELAAAQGAPAGELQPYDREATVAGLDAEGLTAAHFCRQHLRF